MRVLVIGGNRYIGLSLVRELAAAGFDVTVANSHVAELPAGVERVHADRRNPGELRDALAPYADDFEAVFDNTGYELSDIEPLVELFDGRLRHYVFTSSVAVYRRSFVQPVSEDFRVHEVVADQPLRAYGVGKVLCERYLMERHARTGFPATSVRVTHTVGPRSPLPTRDPGFFARLEQGRPILIPGDGFPFIHVIHIDDAARLLMAVIGSDRAVGQIYNGAGAEFASILGTVHLMARTVGVEPNIVQVPLDLLRRHGRAVVHWGEGTAGGTVIDIRKALEHLDWTPRFGLDAAYRDSYDWFRAVGRDLYTFDFRDDDAVLAELARPREPSPERL